MKSRKNFSAKDSDIIGDYSKEVDKIHLKISPYINTVNEIPNMVCIKLILDGLS